MATSNELFPSFGSDWPALTLSECRTQDEINQRVARRLMDLKQAIVSVNTSLNAFQDTATANITKNQNAISDNATAISANKQAITDLNSAFATVQNSWSALQKDYGAFKSQVTSQINDFQGVLNEFQGTLTTLQGAVATNTLNITKLQAAFDPTLWGKMVDAFNNLNGAIDQRIADYDANTVQPALTKERTARQSGDQQNSEAISGVSDRLDTEIQSRTSATSRNSQAIASEAKRATGQETILQANIDAENVRAVAKEGEIATNLQLETNRAKQAEADEAAARDNGDKACNSYTDENIQAEKARAQEAERDLGMGLNEAFSNLQDQVNNNKTTAHQELTDNVQTLATSISTEAQTRQDADDEQREALTGLAGGLDTLNDQTQKNTSDIGDLKTKITTNYRYMAINGADPVKFKDTQGVFMMNANTFTLKTDNPNGTGNLTISCAAVNRGWVNGQKTITIPMPAGGTLLPPIVLSSSQNGYRNILSLMVVEGGWGFQPLYVDGV